jgi:hypothetical protein
MSILQNSIVPVGSTGYDIPYSARFNDDDSAYLSRTPSVAGNRKTWTWSGWVKLGNLGIARIIFKASTAGGFPSLQVELSAAGALFVFDYNSTTQISTTTSALFRDPSAWYNITIKCDTTEATANDRVVMYVNNERQALGINTQPALNYDTSVNAILLHETGKTFDGLLAEVNFVDGQALTPADFGETDETYGHWKAKEYTGTYGTNGFYLDFKNSGSLGNDVSGNNNDWTPNNLAATDQMLDSPTNNFCTFLSTQPEQDVIWYEGNTSRRSGDSYAGFDGGKTTMLVPSSGKWYAEFEMTAERTSDPATHYFGILESDFLDFNASGANIQGLGYIAAFNTNNSINKYNYGAYTAWLSTTVTIGNTVMIAVDRDTGKIWWGHNGSWLDSGNPTAGTGEAYSGVSASTDFLFSCGRYTNDATRWTRDTVNFGQDSSFAGNKTAQGNADDNGIGDFYYAPPTGFLALCTQNLPEPTVVPSEHFNTVAFTSGASSTDVNVGFQPDFVWHKKRNAAENHYLIDQVRGGNKVLWSNLTNAEATATAITAWNTDGYTVDANLLSPSSSYVAWNWKAGGSAVSNTNGTITSSVSANPSAGFSIVSWTGNSTASTLGHGLSEVPEMIIVKNRENTYDWATYHAKNTSAPQTDYLKLNLADATSDNTVWNDTSPTATVFSVSHQLTVNQSAKAMIAYCFHSVEGYSKVGSYTGNGSTDGTFVHCGFRPAYVMVKRTDGGTGNWRIMDATRQDYNPEGLLLRANTSDAEGNDSSSYPKDFLSNGFKIRHTAGGENASGSTYIFLAFAEHPFKYTNAR